MLRPLLDAGGYLPWTEGALRPSALVAVAGMCDHDAGLLLRAGFTAAAFSGVYLILGVAGPGLVGPARA